MAASSDSPRLSSATQRPPRPIVTATPTYSLVSEKLRRVSAGSLQCSLFCGGQRCKYEVPHRWKEEEKALKGLFSHWVTDDILAMARPSTVLFREHDLIAQFKRSGIYTVVNLQLPWEHSKCGPGMESSGFTYQPEELMNHGVYFYNYGWMDYGVPTLKSVLDMVKVVDFAIHEGKVAIHCHAGLGRTGVLIACYLIYSKRLCGDEAITTVRERRPGSIQTRQQIEIVQQFSRLLSPLWQFYPSPSSNGDSLTLQQYLDNQALLLHGYELQDLKYIPKAVYDICSRIVSLNGKQNGPIGLRNNDNDDDAELHHQNGTGILDGNLSRESGQLQQRIEALQVEMNSTLHWTLLPQENSLVVLLHMLFTFFRTLKEPLLSASDISALSNNSSLQVLSEAKSCTIEKVLTTLQLIFTSEGTLSQHGPKLASQLAKLFTYQSVELVSSDQGGEELRGRAVEKLILTLWKL